MSACCCGRARRCRCFALRGGWRVKTRAELVAAGRIRCELDPRERPLHCHHEKTIVIDGREAFVGGIDLTSLSGDRRDSSRHPARAAIGWHDVTSVVAGPVVSDVAEHFALRWREVTGERVAVGAPDPAAGSSTVQLVRTVPEHVYGGLRQGSFGVLETYVRAIRSARAADLHRVPVPVVAGDRRAAGREAPRSAARPVPDAAGAAGPAQGRHRRHARRAGRADRRRRRRRPGARLFAVRARRIGRRPDLRPREGRGDRRSAADRRLGQPQRSLHVQRHRGCARHGRRRAGDRDPSQALGGAPGVLDWPRRRATPPT